MTEETEHQTPDRYVIEASPAFLHIVDTETDLKVESYPAEGGPQAWQRLAVLNRRAAAGMDNPLSEPLTPQNFLTQTLPSLAVQQRSESLSRLLVEAWEVVDQSLSLLKQDVEILNRASRVVRRIEEQLAALNAAPDRMAMEGPDLSKPGPY